MKELVLSNGVRMPAVGLGTWKCSDEEAENAVRTSLELGYRHIDTAAAYGNEPGVGRGLRASKVPREQVFVVTKLWNEDQRTGKVMEAFEASLQRLEMDYVDLYLIHWPVKERFAGSWQVLERIYESGRAKAIGVSNFLAHHLDELAASGTRVTPHVNQVEFHPLLRQQQLLDLCKARNIQHEAWSPLMRGKTGEIPDLRQIGETHGKTPEQVALRWELQKGSVVIPKSTRRERLASNAAIFDFKLSLDEVQRIDALDTNQRLGPDPDTFAF